MPRRVVVLVIAVVVGTCLLGPAARAQKASTPIADAATREAARALAPACAPMRPGLKWTGIGLIVGSGLPFWAACSDDCFTTTKHCRLSGVGAGQWRTYLGSPIDIR